MATVTASKRHLIVEGCDGTGKDTLIGQIRKLRPMWTMHARASTSLGGPVKDLSSWVERDIHDLQHMTTPPSIYNRHPLVSETIYSKYRKKNSGLSGRFVDKVWVETARQIVAPHVILVIVQPPLHVVLEIIDKQGKGAHMDGVYEHILDIYEDYQALVWPGATIRYDRTTSSVKDLMRTIDLTMVGVSNDDN